MNNIDDNLIEDIFASPPKTWPAIISNEILDKEHEDLLFELKEQYIGLNNLGIDYLSQYMIEIRSKTISDMLSFINDKYIAIIDFSSLDYNKLYELFKNLYKILFVDMVLKTIPSICIVNKIKDPSKLIQANSLEVKQLLINHYTTTLKQLNILYPINNSLNEEILKNSFAIDLFNNDLDNFTETFLFTIIQKYNDRMLELV